MLKKEVKRMMWGLPVEQPDQRDVVNYLIVPDFTVTISSNSTSKGTVDVASVTVDEGTPISASSNKLTIGSTVVTATAKSGYTFSSWGTLPSTVTENLSITATFISSSIDA